MYLVSLFGFGIFYVKKLKKKLLSLLLFSSGEVANGVLVVDVVISGGGAGARVLIPELRQGQECGFSGVQVVVRNREVVQEEDIHRQLLRCEPSDGDPTVPGGEIGGAQGQAPFR